MESSSSHSSLTFFFLLLLTLLHPSAASSPPPTASALKFIRDSCNTTLYPTLCYNSLSRHASSITTTAGNNSGAASLARLAIAVSLSTARRAAAHFSTLNLQHDRRAAAVRDCQSTFSDAVDQIRGSLNQMRQLGTTAGHGDDDEATRFQVSNVQTWMSAALTNEDTCTDGFDGVSDDGGELKSDVAAWVEKASKLTSNALALVNSYASTLN